MRPLSDQLFTMRKPLIATLCALLYGCGSMPVVSNQTAQQVASVAKVTHDDFRKFTKVNGQIVHYTDEVSVRFIGIKDDAEGAPVTIDIIFDSTRMYGQSWAFWDSAFDQDGKQLPVSKINSDVEGAGIVFERVGIGVTRDYLESHSSGFKMRVDGRRAKQVLEFYPPQIAGFLSALDSAFGKNAKYSIQAAEKNEDSARILNQTTIPPGPPAPAAPSKPRSLRDYYKDKEPAK